MKLAFIFIISLILVLGGVGGIESSTNNINFIISLVVIVFGLGGMWTTTKLFLNGDYE